MRSSAYPKHGPLRWLLAVAWLSRNWRRALLAVHVGALALSAGIALLGWANRDDAWGTALLVIGLIPSLWLLLRLPWTARVVRAPDAATGVRPRRR